MKKYVNTTIASTVGSVLGATAIRMSGMVAVGMVGKGTGVGSAAGPVGAVLGGIAGLAVYGLYVVAKSDEE